MQNIWNVMPCDQLISKYHMYCLYCIYYTVVGTYIDFCFYFYSDKICTYKKEKHNQGKTPNEKRKKD